MTKQLKVIIDPLVHQKIMFWVRESQGEVSGLGKVVYRDGELFVRSAILCKQTNTGASTDLDPADVAKAMFTLKDEEGHLNFWWHSHVNMDVFWSGTDMSTIEEISKNGWVLATVFNKRNEMRSAYMQTMTTLTPPLFFDELPTEISSDISEAFKQKWKAELDEKSKDTDFDYPDTDWRHWQWRDDAGEYPNYQGNLLDFKGAEQLDMQDPLKEIHDLLADLENEPNPQIAKNILTRACRLIKKKPGLSKEDRLDYKEMFIGTYNDMHAIPAPKEGLNATEQ